MDRDPAYGAGGYGFESREVQQKLVERVVLLTKFVTIENNVFVKDTKKYKITVNLYT